MERILLIGMGEVGRAHYNVLKKRYPSIAYKDKGPEVIGPKISQYDLMLIATQCDPQNMQPFYDMVVEYAEQFKPKHIDVLTTTPCGTCDILQELIPDIPITRSTVRGMHPNLDKFLLTIPKHIGGPKAAELALFYEAAGIKCRTHAQSRAVELFHPLNNFIYGVNVMAADECAKYCRENGVDFMELLEYRKTNNEGFLAAGYPSKVSPILYPSGGKIGGHCVCYAPTTIKEDIRGPLAKLLANYNKDK